MYAKAGSLLPLCSLIVSSFFSSVAQAETVPGSIPAEFSVASGSANYSVPIHVAPGRGGMQPSLSLSYSGSGSHVLGVGWHLNGISSIHRCAATLEQDGFMRGVQFTATDRYCLDGQRLIPVSGSNGAVGAEYTLEIDGYSRIRSVGGTANNPSYWMVDTKAGQRIQFGGANASVSFTPGTQAWSVNTITDTTGNNTISFSYSIGDRTQYLDSVTYPGGRVELSYEARPDQVLNYAHGDGVRMAKRILEIRSYAETQLVRRYTPSYIQLGESGRTYLQQLQECSGENECLSPIEFTHHYAASSLGLYNNRRLPELMYDHINSQRMQYGELVDINGDGLQDLVIAFRSTARITHRRTYINTGSSWVLNGQYALPEMMFDYALLNPHGITMQTGDFQDLNGDGLVDFVIAYRDTSAVLHRRAYLNTGSGWVSTPQYGLPEMARDYIIAGLGTSMSTGDYVDVNGDGLVDYVMAYRTNNRVTHRRTYMNTGSGWRLSNHYILPETAHDYGLSSLKISMRTGDYQDVNGDGLVDYIVSYRDASAILHRRTYINTGSSWSLTPDYTLPEMAYDYALAGRGINVRTGDYVDVNSDGLVDYVVSYRDVSRNTHSRTYLNSGRGWRSHSYNTHYALPYMVRDYALAGLGYHMSTGLYTDINGDGLVDYVVSYRDSSRVTHLRSYLNKGSGWRFTQTIGLPQMLYDYGYGPREVLYGTLGDISGDGLVDYVRASRNPSNQQLFAAYINRNQSIMLDRIRHNEQETNITYEQMTNVAVYTKGTGSQYPVIDLQYPQQLVSTVTSIDGVGGTTTVNYRYEGLKAHARGRGSFGYAKITETYPDTGKTLETFYNQTAFPLAGYVDRVVESYNGQIVNESDSSYTATQSGGVYQLYLSQKVDKSYELNGNLTTTVTTQNSNLDAYGNIGTVTVTTTADNPYTLVSETFSKTTQSTYTNDTTNWYLGRLVDSTVTHSAPGQPDQQRRSTFSYDNATGLLVSESVVSTSTSAPLTTTATTYDAYGQKTEVRTTATGETDRVTTTAYNSSGRPTQTCNALNQCETYTYTPEGWLATTTGPNSITTTWEYDGFGRKSKETRADGTETTIAHHFASPASGTPQCGVLANHAYTCMISQTTGSQPATVQYDALGREVRKIATGFDGRLIYSDTEYNSLAQLSRISRNYFMGDQIYWANSEYDALNRVTSMDEPAPHGTRNAITTAYNGLITTVTSGPDARQKLTYTNALGQVIRREEEEGSYVAYTYSADGNLATTTVAGNADTTITLSYDEFGRKVGMDDPDMGIWSYSYNAFGQLTSQTDAKGQTTTMAYDVLGRMTSRTDLAGTASATTSTWTYGDANDPVNPATQGSIGKLLSETDGTVTKTYFYDTLGRPDETNTTMDVGTADEHSFTTQTLYDSLGRVSRTIYPGSDNFYTENIYNANGFIEKVRGLRSKSETYDLSTLLPLISDAVTLAADYQTQANELKTLGEFYETKITEYQAIIDAGTSSGTLDSSLQSNLTQHQTALNAQVNTANTNAKAFYGHLNNTVVELQTLTTLINTSVHNYQTMVEQLTVLAEQTLAAADNSFQYERTLTRGTTTYTALANDATYTNYWTALEVDASGRISAEVYGNGITNDYTYNQATGQLQHIHSSLLVVDPIRHLEYQYDRYQNVTSREDHANDIRETYEYDRLDRLTKTDITSSTYVSTEFNGSQTQTYDVLGNITHKSDVGNYTYGSGAGPHAVTAAGGNTYTYDANGNMLTGDGRAITWSSFNKPTLITRGTSSAEFFYDQNRARYKKINHSGDTTRYVGKLYEHKTTNSGATTEEKHYVYAMGQLVAEHIVSTAHGVQTRYLHKDALGSVDLITDAHANVVDRRSFDAWGKLRNLTWKDTLGTTDPLYLTQLPFTDKGFTGHEHIQEVGLIHMNGRVYDATLARFLSSDPHIQEGALTQSYNRYSYVMNNPLKYTDPSGYFFKKIFRAVKKVVKKVAKAAEKAYSKYWQATRGSVLRAIAKVPVLNAVVGAALCTNPLTCAAYAAASSYAVTGDLGEALKAGFAAYFTKEMSGRIANFEGALDHRAIRAVAHGVVGGATAEMRGGKFGAGFKSSFFTKMLSGNIKGFAKEYLAGSAIAGAAIAAVVGGTASRLGGGKFSNGAQTAAIQYLYNEMTDEARKIAEEKAKEMAVDKALDKLDSDELKSLKSMYDKVMRSVNRAKTLSKLGHDGVGAILKAGVADVTHYDKLSASPTGRYYYTNRVVNWGKVDWRKFDEGGDPLETFGNFLKYASRKK